MTDQCGDLGYVDRERKAIESSVVNAVKAQSSYHETNDLRRTGWVLESIGLRGSYPNTAVTISMQYEGWHGAKRQFLCEIWADEPLLYDRNGDLDPEAFATLIWDQVVEHLVAADKRG